MKHSLAVLSLALLSQSAGAFSYGDAIDQMRMGNFVARAGWTDRFAYLLPGSSISVARPPLLYIFGAGQHIHQFPRFEVCDGTPPQLILCRVYMPSLDDMLASDWQIFP